MSNPYETKSYEQLRKEVTERILAQGGTPFDVAIELFKLRHDPAAKVPGLSVKERKTVVIKEGPENSAKPQVSLDGTTVVITTKNARRRGLENVAVGEMWSETGEVPGITADSSARATASQQTGRAIDSQSVDDAAEAPDAAEPQEQPPELNSDNSTVSSRVTAPASRNARAPAQKPPAMPRLQRPAAGPGRPSVGGLGM